MHFVLDVITAVNKIIALATVKFVIVITHILICSDLPFTNTPSNQKQLTYPYSDYLVATTYQLIFSIGIYYLVTLTQQII